MNVVIHRDLEYQIWQSPLFYKSNFSWHLPMNLKRYEGGLKNKQKLVGYSEKAKVKKLGQLNNKPKWKTIHIVFWG